MKKKYFITTLAVLLILTMPIPAYADYGSIRIDGYYDDWEDKPHTEVYNGNQPPDGKINYVSLFREEDSIYGHIKFAEKNNQGIKNMVIDIFTNLGNESYWVGSENQSHGTWSFTVDQNSDPVGEGYYTLSEDDNGEAEFRIPLTTITNEIDGISDISMRIKKVGKQSIVCVGADTGPYFGVALGAGVVLASFACYTYKRKRPLMKEKVTD